MADVSPDLGVSDVHQEENVVLPGDDEVDLKRLGHNTTGVAVVEQGHTIPTTGERKTTTTWEYWSYCLYGKRDAVWESSNIK